jgi:hypothetical protein
MSLVPYTSMLFFPGGGQASGASIGIGMDGSNQVPMIYLDAGAVVPAPNPMIADGTGTIMFFAAPGLYVAELAGTFLRVPVDPTYGAPVWPDLWVHMQTVAATVWTVDHYFGTKPSVSIDLGTNQVEAEVDHPSLTQTVLTFTTAQTGAAYLRR